MLKAIAFFAMFLPAQKADYSKVEAYQRFVAGHTEWALFQDDGACWVTSNPVFISKQEEAVENYYMIVSFFFGSAEPEISYYLNGTGEDDLVAYAGE